MPLLIIVFAGLVMPVIFALMLFPFVVELQSQYDPESLERPDGAGVPVKVAIAAGILAMLGGFFFALWSVRNGQHIWLMAAWPFWIGALQLLKRWAHEDD